MQCQEEMGQDPLEGARELEEALNEVVVVAEWVAVDSVWEENVCVQSAGIEKPMREVLLAMR